MSTSHQDSDNNQRPITTAEPHHQPPPSSSTENLPGFTTLCIPKTPSPTTTPPSDQSSVETTTSTTPESLLAAAIGRAILNISSTNPLVRTLSDASVNQDSSITTTTPPPPPKNTIPTTKTHPLFHAVSNMINTNQQPQKKRPNKPVRRALSDTAEYQQSKKTRTPPPRISSSTGNPSPCLERMRKVEDMIREIEQRCSDIMRNQDDHNSNPNPNTPRQSQAVEEEEDEKEECVGVERVDNGGIKFELNCSCGKRFEMLIKPNGYCFYRLT